MPLDNMAQMIRGGTNSIGDFQRLQQEFELKKQLAQAEIAKSQQLDVDKLGEVAFMKAAMGQELSPQELAAAKFVDAKSGGLSLNPVTGEFYQKPRISDKIGLQGMTPPVEPTIAGQNVTGLDQGGNAGNVGRSLPFNPKMQNVFDEENIKRDRARLDQIIADKVSSSGLAANDKTIKNLLPRVGYTGLGGSALGYIDKGLTALGMGGAIEGDPAARETMKKVSVDQWVSSVTPLKGALTEQEGARFDQAVSNLDTTAEGIKLREKLSSALAQRAQEKSEFYQEWFNQNGSLSGADSVWDNYANENPVIPEGFFGTSDSSAAPAPAPATQGQAMEIEFKLRQKGFTPSQVDEYMKAKGLK